MTQPDSDRERMRVLLDRLAAVERERDDLLHSPVLQAVLDAIAGTIDTSTNIADHPNVKFAQMERLKLIERAEHAESALLSLSQQLADAQAENAALRDNNQAVKALFDERATALLSLRNAVRDTARNWQVDARLMRQNKGQRTREKCGHEMLETCAYALAAILPDTAGTDVKA